MDTYWSQTGGTDPVGLIQTLDKRAALLHLKDGPATKEAAQVALGEGVMNVPSILSARQTDTLVIELDRCATDMLEAVEKSQRYLKGLL